MDRVGRVVGLPAPVSLWSVDRVDRVDRLRRAARRSRPLRSR
jgi:hypothetical protein